MFCTMMVQVHYHEWWLNVVQHMVQGQWKSLHTQVEVIESLRASSSKTSVDNDCQHLNIAYYMAGSVVRPWVIR